MFYIIPPRGKVTLHSLEENVFARFDFLTHLDNDNTDNFNGNFEYLLENTACDSVGHFALRLIVAASSNLSDFLIKNEGLLFERRLEQMSQKEYYRLFRKIAKHLNQRRYADNDVSRALTAMCEHFLKPHVFRHLLREENHTDCPESYRCYVPFAAIPDLVKRREIELNGGNGTVLCSTWKNCLASLYRNFLRLEMKQMESAAEIVAADPRLAFMSKVINQVHDRKCGGSLRIGNITAKNIDTEAKKFPPCMQNLHAILREKHRLSHHARFQYSLFIKECGMSMENAIRYWREEYRKPHTCQSGCTHSWQKDERKFLYSIRHMYGLEGSRKNYRAPNCKAICGNVPGLRYEGGCPFKHFDASKLGTLLNESGVRDELSLKVDKIPEVTCSNYLKLIHGRENEDIVISSPVQYYLKVIESG